MRIELLTALFVLMLVLFGCHNDDNVEPCGEDLEWLDQRVLELEDQSYFYVTQGSYQGETVFIFKDCCPFCVTVWLVFSCAGEQLGSISFNDIAESDISNETLYWTPENFECTVSFN